MARVVHPDSLEYQGPWILERGALTDLQSILDETWQQMGLAVEEDTNEEISREVGKEQRPVEIAAIEKRVREGQKYRNSAERRLFQLSCKSRRRIEAQTLQEAMDDLSLKDEVVLSLDYNARRGDHKVSLNIGNYSDGRLSYKVSDIDKQYASQSLSKIDRWASAIRPSIWLRSWKSLAGIQWALLCAMLVLCSVWLGAPSESSQLALAQRGRELLSRGITQSNSSEAITILLAREVKYQPPDGNSLDSKPNGVRILSILGITFVVCIMLQFPPPKVVFELGKGEASARRWKRWTRFVLGTVPATVVATFVWPRIVDLINQLLMP